ncbi:transposase [Bacillus sp. FJAT-49754]|uniref:Transposase n=1 Tax=Lederbergia citrea TaxID=2833581 RepID=A0A942ULZ0_9BACI|nr:transposase [Lederbergia citrea]MBS4221228.1 transposase [Lederbergia citrea]
MQGLGCLAYPAGVERTLLQTNTAYRWFLGFDFHTKVPHFTTFGKNYVCRFQDTELFEQIFYHILVIIDKKFLAQNMCTLIPFMFRQVQLNVSWKRKSGVKKLAHMRKNSKRN